MRCEDARVHISREIDGELPAGKREAMQRHVEQCADCARFAEQCRAIGSLMADSEVHAPDAAYRAELLRRVREAAAEQAGRKELRPRAQRVLSYLAAAACVLLFVCVVIQQGRIAHLRAEISHLRTIGAGPVVELQDFGAIARVSAVLPVGVPEQAEAFRMLSDYFQGGLKWLVQDGRQSELGVAGDISLAAATAGTALRAEIRLVRVEGGGEARVISAPTLTIVSGEEASFSLAATDGLGPGQFRYRCAARRTERGRVLLAVALEVNPPAGGEPARLWGLAELHEGQWLPVAYTQMGDASYLLLVGSSSEPPAGREEPGT